MDYAEIFKTENRFNTSVNYIEEDDEDLCININEEWYVMLLWQRITINYSYSESGWNSVYFPISLLEQIYEWNEKINIIKEEPKRVQVPWTVTQEEYITLIDKYNTMTVEEFKELKERREQNEAFIADTKILFKEWMIKIN